MRAGTGALYHGVIARPSPCDIWPPARDAPSRWASWSRLGGAMAQTVCLCGSFRHWAEMLEWPTPDVHRGPVTMTGDEARAAILAHLDRIDRAERIFVYDKEGYATPLRDPATRPRLTGAA